MNDKDVQDSTNSKKGIKIAEKKWSFCPICGKKIPEINKLKFCISCGVNLQYIREHKQLHPKKVLNPYIIPTLSPQSYLHPIKIGPKKILDEEILNTKDHKLWGTMHSIGIPLGAFLLMSFITAGLIVIIVFFSFNLEILYDLISNPYFLIFSSFFELIFILVPVLYVGKYLQRPTLKNRLGLLGFTRKGFNRVGLIKEILIGLGFAIAGVIIVFGITILTAILLESIFGSEIIRDVSGATSDVDILISSSDILSLVLLSLVMILIIGTSEEILFRGFMQKGLTRSLGKWGGILITAFIFAMIHVLGVILYVLESPLVLFISFLLSFFPYFAISLLLGLIYYWRKENLIAVIITHGVYNALTIILAFFFYNIF